MAAYDLHIHSGYSNDGELPVAAIVGLCAARGLDAFSLTDHNSVRGVGEAARLACAGSFCGGLSLITTKLSCFFRQFSTISFSRSAEAITRE